MNNFTWVCEICGKERPDNQISVIVFDDSLKYELPLGTVKRNINHCNDNEECIKGATKRKPHTDI